MIEPARELIELGNSRAAGANYSPAVRVGSHVFVAGMIAMKDGEIVGKGDVIAQTQQVIANIDTVLTGAGATFAEIVRYRIYLTDINDLTSVRTVLTPAFGSIRPAGTLVAVSALVHPDLKIEIDVDAVIGSALT